MLGFSLLETVIGGPFKTLEKFLCAGLIITVPESSPEEALTDPTASSTLGITKVPIAANIALFTLDRKNFTSQRNLVVKFLSMFPHQLESR